MRSRMHDRIIGVLLILLSLWYMYETTNFRRAMLSDPLGSRMFPRILAGVMMVLSIYLIVRPDENAVWPKGESWLRIGLVTLSFIAYAYLLVPLGFIVTTALEMVALAVLFNGPPLRALVASAIFSVALYGLFDYLLGLGLPTGQVFLRLMGGS